VSKISFTPQKRKNRFVLLENKEIMMKYLCVLLTVISLSLPAAEITVEQYKKILVGKVTQKVSKEMQFFPMFKDCQVSVELNSPGREPFKGENKGTEKYIDGKYIVSTITFPNGVTLTSILSWDEKLKTYCQWNLTPDGGLWSFTAKTIKDNKKSLQWSGKSNKTGETYIGTVTYGPKKVTWQGKYFKEGSFLFSEKGMAVKTDLK
jgi:hypothetical protein